MRIRFIILLFMIGFYSGCSEDPNSVGSALIPENDRLKVITIDSQTESFEQNLESFRKDSLFFGSSKRLLLGEYENIKSEVLLRFNINLPDSIENPLESSDSVSLNSAWIEIFPDYWLGDKDNIDFTAQEIFTSWNPVNFNQDTLNNVVNNLGSSIIERIENIESDTLIRFYIDKDIATNWIYKSFDDSFPPNYGIYLSPLSNNAIVGFQGVSFILNRPLPILNMEFEKINDFVDTAFAESNIDIHIPSGDTPENPVNEVVLQGGIALRGKLKFSLETVPDRILVNNALLQLFYNSSNSFEANVKTDTIAVSMLNQFNGDSVRIEFGRYPLVKNDDHYQGDIKQFVQRWIDGEANEGLELKLTDENRGASKISLFGSSHPDVSLRPRLTISYTQK